MNGITINSYQVVEQGVYSGVSVGVSKLLSDVSNFSKPEIVVETISDAVMNELCGVLDFGSEQVRFTPDLLKKMWLMAQEEAVKESPPEKKD